MKLKTDRPALFTRPNALPLALGFPGPANRQPRSPWRRLQGIARLLTLLLVTALPPAALGQTTVSFPDPHLEAAVRSALNKPTGDLTSTDMLSLRFLGAANLGITNLSGLEGALHLQRLNLENNAVEDVTPLAGLTALQGLLLDSNHLADASALAGLTSLTELELDYNSLHDLSWAAGLTQLQSLTIMFNPLGSGAALAGLTNLTDLHLNGTGISDVSFLSGLTQLTALGLGENGISDASPLAGLTHLTFLGVGGNAISNWDFLHGLTNLKTLYLFSDSVSDLSILANLTKLTWLRVSQNHITDASPLAGLHQLRYLDLSWNPLTSGATLAGLTSLQALDLHHAQLANLDFSPALTVLTNLNLNGNQLGNINGLLGAHSLSFVDLTDNPLDLSPGSPANNVIQTLLQRGVTVDSSVAVQPFVATNGTYNGLVYDRNAITPAHSGAITLTTMAQGKYTAKLQLGAASYPVSGTFAADGTDSRVLKRGKLAPLLLSLLRQGSDVVTGTLSTSGENWSADVLAYRAVFDGKTNACPQAGHYTLSFAGSNAPTLPAGTGYGTVTVSAAGKLTLAGALADGTKFSQTASLSANGQWPLYAPLYARQGLVLSWVVFTSNQTLGGDLAWNKPAGKTKYYPAGFAWLTQAAGARYTAPGKDTNAFGLTASSLNLTLSGGGLNQDLVSQFTLNAKDQVKALPAASKLSLSFSPSTGLFQGRAVDPASRKAVTFGGVILQNQADGCGYFLGTSTSGQVLLNQ